MGAAGSEAPREPRRSGLLSTAPPAVQVPHVRRCAAGPGRCPVHVLPLLHLPADRQVPRAHHPAVPSTGRGVHALRHRRPCSAKGEPGRRAGPCPTTTARGPHTVPAPPQVFLSIKGIYYQAEVLGQPIVWITPYTLSHYVSVSLGRVCGAVAPSPVPRGSGRGGDRPVLQNQLGS